MDIAENLAIDIGLTLKNVTTDLEENSTEKQLLTPLLCYSY